MIVNNENNNIFYLKKFFYQFVIVNNQDIFNIKEKIKLSFFVKYNKSISIKLIF